MKERGSFWHKNKDRPRIERTPLHVQVFKFQLETTLPNQGWQGKRKRNEFNRDLTKKKFDNTHTHTKTKT